MSPQRHVFRYLHFSVSYTEVKILLIITEEDNLIKVEINIAKSEMNINTKFKKP